MNRIVNPPPGGDAPLRPARRGFHRSLVAMAAAALTGTGRQAGAATTATRFALIGDTPYGEAEVDGPNEVLRHAAGDSDFVVHVGDIKSGLESCDDELLQRRLAALRASARPLVYVPGDNEWTDCHRVVAGSYDPLERLRRLRELAFGGPPADAPAGLVRQAAEWPEHQRWQAGPALFVTLNMPGSSNGLRTRVEELEHRRRATAATGWLVESASAAREAGLAVLVVALQANVELHRLNGGDPDHDVIDPDNPYAWFRGLLWQIVCRFPGQVLLLNGDDHTFIDDRPWRFGRFARLAAQRFDVPLALVQERMATFRRLQTFGSPWSRAYLSVLLATRDGVRPIVDVQVRRL